MRIFLCLMLFQQDYQVIDLTNPSSTTDIDNFPVYQHHSINQPTYDTVFSALLEHQDSKGNQENLFHQIPLDQSIDGNYRYDYDYQQHNDYDYQQHNDYDEKFTEYANEYYYEETLPTYNKSDEFEENVTKGNSPKNQTQVLSSNEDSSQLYDYYQNEIIH